MTNIYKLESDYTTGKVLFLAKDITELEVKVRAYLTKIFISFIFDIDVYSDKLIIQGHHSMAPLKVIHLSVVPFETNVEVIQ